MTMAEMRHRPSGAGAKASVDAAPAGGLVIRPREVSGNPPVGHYDPSARSSLD